MNKKLCYRVILRFESKYLIRDMCRLFEVSYSSYYKWRLRQQRPDCDLWLTEKIQERYAASKNSAGYRQITLQMKTHYGLTVNHKAVYRIMRKLGIQSVARRRRPYTRYSEAIHRYDNILSRDFKAERNNQKWVTDITYIHTRQGILYLSAIKDLYDGFIVGIAWGRRRMST